MPRDDEGCLGGIFGYCIGAITIGAIWYGSNPAARDERCRAQGINVMEPESGIHIELKDGYYEVRGHGKRGVGSDVASALKDYRSQ
jgi:hypothetical protein